jgi:chromosome segregation ATPase
MYESEMEALRRHKEDLETSIGVKNSHTSKLEKELRQSKIKALSIKVDLDGLKSPLRNPISMSSHTTDDVETCERVQELVTFEEEMKRLQDAESKIDALNREIENLQQEVEKGREDSASRYAALEMINIQLKSEHNEKLSDYEQMMLKMEAERKQIEDDLAAKLAAHEADIEVHKNEIELHKGAIDNQLAMLDGHKEQLSTYEMEMTELKRHREALEAEMKVKAADHAAEIARQVDTHKETLEEQTQRVQRENSDMIAKISDLSRSLSSFSDSSIGLLHDNRQLELSKSN